MTDEKSAASPQEGGQETPSVEDNSTENDASAAVSTSLTTDALLEGPLADSNSKPPGNDAPAQEVPPSEDSPNELPLDELPVTPSGNASPQGELAGQETAASGNEPGAGETAGAGPTETGSADASAANGSVRVSAEAPGATGQTSEGQANPPRRPRIQVGSRRAPAAETGSSSAPAQVPKAVTTDAETATPVPDPAEQSPPPSSPASSPSATPVPPPSRRDPITPDLQKEMDEALGDVSLENLMEEKATVAAQEIELDSRHRAAIVRIHGEHVFFSLGGRNEGVIPIRQFPAPPSVGDEADVVVKSYQSDEGLYELQVAGSAVDVSDWSDLVEGAVVDARITGANTGGLECMLNHIRGFIPASQIALFRVEEFADYIGQKLPCVVTEVNPKRKNLVVSHRAYLERQREEARRALLENLEPGQELEGVVRNLREFGAFVDLGGVDGLIHVSQLSWERVEHPREVLEEGQKVRVRIEKVNPQTGKISLAYRDLSEHPWANAESQYPIGSLVKGPVSRIAKFGAFVKLAPGVEGLIHISELAHRRVRQVSDVVREGQEVEAKVLSVDPQAQRLALSLKAAQPEPEPAEQNSEPAARELAVSRRKKPLKGGFDRPSGGEEFGLRW